MIRLNENNSSYIAWLKLRIPRSQKYEEELFELMSVFFFYFPKWSNYPVWFFKITYINWNDWIGFEPKDRKTTTHHQTAWTTFWKNIVNCITKNRIPLHFIERKKRKHFTILIASDSWSHGVMKSRLHSQHFDSTISECEIYVFGKYELFAVK